MRVDVFEACAFARVVLLIEIFIEDWPFFTLQDTYGLPFTP